jgi:hypothetical protein
VADIIIDAASIAIECKGSSIGSIIRLATPISPRVRRIDGISVVSIPAASFRGGRDSLCRGRAEELGRLGKITIKSLLPSAWDSQLPRNILA